MRPRIAPEPKNRIGTERIVPHDPLRRNGDRHARWLACLLTLAAQTASAQTIFDAPFSNGSDGFVYVDDAFLATHAPEYANGERVAGIAGASGVLTITLGNRDSLVVNGMSGGWSRAFVLDRRVRDLRILFRCQLIQASGYEPDELGQIMVMLDGTPLERWSFPSPPTAVEGVVFAPAFSIEGFVNCHVAAFDVHTGEPLWDSWIVSGQVEQTMFGEQATEPLCAPVAVSNGVVYYSTSFGCVAALDANTGRPLWITEYDQIEVRAPRGYYADPRTIGWENNAPIVESGVVVVAPLDSPKYLGLDARTGERLWANGQRATAVEGEMRYLLGGCTVGGQGVVVLGGGGQVRCLAVRGGKLLWTAQLRGRVVAGRGCIARSPGGELVVLVPVDRNEMFTIQVETGKQNGNFNVGTTGNIVLCGDHALVTGNGVLSVHRLGAATAPGAAQPPKGQDF